MCEDERDQRTANEALSLLTACYLKNAQKEVQAGPVLLRC